MTSRAPKRPYRAQGLDEQGRYRSAWLQPDDPGIDPADTVPAALSMQQHVAHKRLTNVLLTAILVLLVAFFASIIYS